MKSFFVFIFFICSNLWGWPLWAEQTKTSLQDVEPPGELSTLRLEKTDDSDGSEKKGFRLEFDGEWRSQYSRLKTDPSPESHEVYEAALKLHTPSVSNVSGFLDAGFEVIGEESVFVLNQAYLNWEWQDRLQARAGRFYYPVGYLNEQDKYYALQPPFVSHLTTSTKGVDQGLELKARLWNRFFASASTFAGQTFRPQEQTSGRAEKTPRAFSLSFEHNQLQVFATRFEHDLVYFDPLVANGAGLKAQWPGDGSKWNLGLQAEFWQIHEEMALQSEQITNSYYVSPSARYAFVGLGALYFNSTKNMYLEGQKIASTDEMGRALRLEIYPLPFLKFYLENYSLEDDVPRRNGWAARMLAHWDLNI